MHKQKTFLAIIPARGGSKRLPRKNLLDLHGKPLIAWSIEAGLNCRYIDKVVVSSDDDEILEISQKFGADILKRPTELANDTAKSFDAIEHTIKSLKLYYDYIVLLQPTSPLRESKHIDESIELLEKKDADAVISVCEVEHSPLWSNTLDDTLSMKGFLRDEVLHKRSQDIEKYYRINGAIYICKTEKLIEEKSFFLKDNIFAYVMDRESSVDIDEEVDFKITKSILNTNDYSSFAKELIASYTRLGFGKLLKSEIDLLIFEFVLKTHFATNKDEYFIDTELNYFAINKYDIYQLSKTLKVSESKISTMIEQLGLLKGLLNDSIGMKSLKALLLSQLQNRKNIKDGYISIQITNKLLKQFAEAKIQSLGIQVDYEKNKEIIKFDILALIDFFDIHNELFINWLQQQNKFFNDADIRKIQKFLTKETLSYREMSAEVSKTILSKFIEKGSDALVESFLVLIGGLK